MNRLYFLVGALPISMLTILTGCKSQDTTKVIQLEPVHVSTERLGGAGSRGFCMTVGDVTDSPFAAIPGDILVGFDNFFRPGSGPFPCDDFRARVFLGAVQFDVSKFDDIGTASLTFNVVGSVQRAGGQNIGSSPPASHATTLGMAKSPSSTQFDQEVALPAGSGQMRVWVTGQVRDWVDNVHPNFGFVFAGPRPIPDTSHPPKDSDAALSWYRGFKLEIYYNAADNPRAP